MGCFSSSKSNSPGSISDRLCSYPRNSTQNISFILTEPTQVSCKELTLASEKVLISSCVLPGVDPRGEYKKKCQDNCFYLFDHESILCCLFDGHGQEGEKVASFCEKIIENLFIQKKHILKVRKI